MADKQRNYGIDLLRVVSMLMVCVLHILGQGGIIDNTVRFSGAYNVAWFLEAAAFCAVNCYAMISGYVGVTSKKQKYTNIVMLWLQVASVCVACAVIFFVLTPEAVGKRTVLESFFPVTHSKYWYFTVYFLLFFFMPILNSALTSFGRKQMRNTLIVLFVLLSLVPTYMQKDIFVTVYGYTTIWLMFLYLAGGYIRLYNPLENVKKRWLALAYLVFTAVTWLPKGVIELIQMKMSGEVSVGNTFMYTCPTVALAAVALVILFSRIQLKRTKIVSLLASVSFGVYIIHENPILVPHTLVQRFTSFANFHWAVLPFAVIGVAVALYIVCGAVEYIRIKIFELLKIKNIVSSIETKLTK